MVKWNLYASARTNNICVTETKKENVERRIPLWLYLTCLRTHFSLNINFPF